MLGEDLLVNEFLAEEGSDQIKYIMDLYMRDRERKS
jgi:hypothetical protein